MDKPKMIPVMDESEADEIAADQADLGKPYSVKPNGHLWADADELQAWRIERERTMR